MNPRKVRVVGKAPKPHIRKGWFLGLWLCYIPHVGSAKRVPSVGATGIGRGRTPAMAYQNWKERTQ